MTPLERVVATLAMSVLLVAGLTAASRLSDTRVVDSFDDLEAPAAISDEEMASAQEAAGCDLRVDGEPLEDRRHLDPKTAPPAAALYPDDRPAHSGRHYGSVLDLPDRIPDEAIDERAVLHNMEHGSVVVWFAAGVDATDIAAMESWMRERRALGFASDAEGGIFVSPSPDLPSGPTVALRAWGVALDCDRFDVTVADAFLQRHWGSHGASPEAHLSPFPAGVLGETGDFV